MDISRQKQREIIDALRRGTVPKQGLESFAVGLEGFISAIDSDLELVKSGGSVFKAVRGEYGSGKTFFVRWIQERAKQRGFAAAEVQISESETPLYKLETLYRRSMERLSTGSRLSGAFREIIDAWFYTLEEDILASGKVDPQDEQVLMETTTELMEKRLSTVTRNSPAFAAALRGYRQALLENDIAASEGMISWLSGQPHVTAQIKKPAGIKGEVDHFAALSFLQGLLIVLRDSGHPGLVWVMDEVETLQRVRADVRDKSLNALRQLVDEIDAGRFPGLYLIITGTSAFFDGPQGMKRLPPLAQRLHTDFSTDAKFDNPRAVQIRLKGFDQATLTSLGCRIRDIYAAYSEHGKHICETADETYLESLSQAVIGNLGGNIGIAPRLFLKKLVGDVLDRIDQFAAFDPRRDYALTLMDSEMSQIERSAALSANHVNDIELEI